MKTKKTSLYGFKASGNKKYRYKAVVEKINGFMAVAQLSVQEDSFSDHSLRQFKTVAGKSGFISTHNYDRLVKKKYKELYNSEIEELANLSSFIEKNYGK